jgi:hypothetical protein
MEVELMPVSMTGSLMGLMALSSRRRALVVTHRLDIEVFLLPVQRTGKAGADSSPTPPGENIPPSDSQNLPQTGGGRHRMAAWRRNLLTG